MLTSGHRYWICSLLLLWFVANTCHAFPDLWSTLRLLGVWNTQLPTDPEPLKILQPIKCDSDSLNVFIDYGGGDPDEMATAYARLNKCQNLRSMRFAIA